MDRMAWRYGPRGAASVGFIGQAVVLLGYVKSKEGTRQANKEIDQKAGALESDLAAHLEKLYPGGGLGSTVSYAGMSDAEILEYRTQRADWQRTANAYLDWLKGFREWKKEVDEDWFVFTPYAYGKTLAYGDKLNQWYNQFEGLGVRISTPNKPKKIVEDITGLVKWVAIGAAVVVGGVVVLKGVSMASAAGRMLPVGEKS